MTDFDLGPGWREVTYEQWRGDNVPPPEDTASVCIGAEEHYYFRKRSLPTEPYTVIRVEWGRGARKGARDVLWLSETGAWVDREGTFYGSETAGSSITDFEVLAEPPAATAKAFYVEIRRLLASGVVPEQMHKSLDAIAYKFGVES